MILKKLLTFLKIYHIIIIQRLVVFDTMAIEYGVPLPKALKCGTIKEALASYFF